MRALSRPHSRWLLVATLVTTACDLDALFSAGDPDGPSVVSDDSARAPRSRRRRRPRRSPFDEQAAPLPAPLAPAPSAPAEAPGSIVRGPYDPAGQVALGVALDRSPQDEYLLRRPQYVISYNRFRNAPNWAAWRLSAADLGSTGRTRRGFAPDPDLPDGAYRVLHTDYRASGYDRGHLCPSSHRTAHPDDNAATFVMSNVLPQVHEMNAGAWESLEAWQVSMARRGWDLYTYAGGLWPAVCATHRTPQGNPVDPSCPTVGERYEPAQRVAVPQSMWKVVVLVPAGRGLGGVTAETPAIAVDIPNDPGATGDWRGYQLTVDALEARTGYDFLTAVPPAVQAVIESRVPRLQ